MAVRRVDPAASGSVALPPWLSSWRYPLPINNSQRTSDLLHFEHAPVQLSPFLEGDGAVEIAMAVPSSTAAAVVAAATAAAAAPEDVLFRVGLLEVTSERLVYASVVLVVTLLLVVSSVVTIAVVLTSEALRDVVGYYLISLAVSDLLCGVAVTPFSVYAALDPQWRFFGEDSLLCKIEAYFEIIVWNSTVYIFMWLGVDRFVALAKPSRYDVEQTFTRCKCWIAFTWVTSMLLSCPILVAEMRARYYAEAGMCVLDWSATGAYSTTLAVLVVTPSLISIVYTYNFIFSSLRDPTDLEDSQRMVLEQDHNFVMTFFVIVVFALSWLPWFALLGVEHVWPTAVHEQLRPLHFSLIWLAIGGGSWKLLIYLTMSAEFRAGLLRLARALCCVCCRRRKHADRSHYQSVAQQRQRYL